MATGLGLKKLSFDMVGTLGRQLAAGGIQLLTIILIARLFGPEGNGQYAIAMLLPMSLASVLNLGIGPANVYYIGSRSVTPQVALRTSVKLWLFLSSMGVLLGGAVIVWASDSFSPGSDSKILWTALVIFPLVLLQGFIASILQGLQQFKLFNLLLIVQPITTFVLICLLALADVRQIEFVIVSYAVGVLVALSCSARNLKSYLVEPVSSTNYSNKVISYGYKAHLSNILAFLNYRADLFILNLLVGPVATGIYVVAAQLTKKLWLLSQAVSTVLLPRLSELSKDEDKRSELTPVICRWVLLTTMFAALLLALIAEPTITLLFGGEYIHGVVPLLILLPGVVTGSASRVLANDIAARGRPELNLYTSIIVVIVNIVGNLVLIPGYGIAGAAFATSFAYGLNLILRLIVYSRFTNCRWRQLLMVNHTDFNRLFKVLFGAK